MKLALEAGSNTIPLAAEFGIRGIPIDGGALITKAEATLAPLQEHGLAPCQIGAFGFNPLLEDESERSRREATLAQIVELAPSLEGNPCVVISGGNWNPDLFGQFDPRNFLPETIDLLADRLRSIVELAAEKGARISIEPYLKGAMSSPRHCSELAEKLGHAETLRFNLDPTSLYDFRDLVDPSSMIESVCEELGPRTGLIHVKEVGLDKGFHLHAGLVPLGKGPTDWVQFLKSAAVHAPADTWILLEHVMSPEEARSSIAILRDAAAQAGITLE